MSNLIYTKKVLEHFRNPHNYGQIKNADGTGEVGNLACGDVMKLYIKISLNSKKEEIIKDIKFETLGCAAAIATSSVVTDLAKNRTIKKALELNNQDVIKVLKNLPPIKIHCSLLAVDALTEAVFDYYQKNNKEIPQFLLEKHQQLHRRNHHSKI